MATKGNTVEMTVRVTRRQAATFIGKSLVNVSVDDDFVIVKRKRLRGGHVDNHYYPRASVLAYMEGDGGKDSPAYATVMTDVVIRSVSGEGVIDGDSVKVVDEDGRVHVFSLSACGDSISVAEKAGDVTNGVPEKPKRVRSAPESERPQRRRESRSNDSSRPKPPSARRAESF
jgi:hypothetical protein